MDEETKIILHEILSGINDLKSLLVSNKPTVKKNALPSSIEEIQEQVDCKFILDRKNISLEKLNDTIMLAKTWMMDNPKKGKESNWTIRTSRVMTFLSEVPNKNNTPKKREL